MLYMLSTEALLTWILSFGTIHCSLICVPNWSSLVHGFLVVCLWRLSLIINSWILWTASHNPYPAALEKSLKYIQQLSKKYYQNLSPYVHCDHFIVHSLLVCWSHRRPSFERAVIVQWLYVGFGLYFQDLLLLLLVWSSERLGVLLRSNYWDHQRKNIKRLPRWCPPKDLRVQRYFRVRSFLWFIIMKIYLNLCLLQR